MTMQVYSHVTKDMQTDAADLIGALIAGPTYGHAGTVRRSLATQLAARLKTQQRGCCGHIDGPLVDRGKR